MSRRVLGHTAGEASDLICPMKATRCYSDQCMAWRWAAPAPEGEMQEGPRLWYPLRGVYDHTSTGPTKDFQPGRMPPGVVWDGARGCWSETDEMVRERIDQAHAARRGFCGLAGKP